MTIIDLSTITSAIVAIGVDATWERVKRRETVIKLLERFKLDPINPPTDFDGIYAYTLIEYGPGRPEPIVNFFHYKFVREAFWQSLYKNDPSILDKEAEDVIQWNEETGRLGRIDYDPRREFAAFGAIFQEIVSRTRTPADVKRDQKLDDIREDIHQKTGEIIEHLKRFDALNELRVEIARLAEIQKVVPSPPADVELRVRGLLEAMGYRINDAGSVGTDLYFLCDIKSGAKISQEVVHFVNRQPAVDDIVQLDETLVRLNAKEGILLTRESLSDVVRDVAQDHNRIQCYTLNEFIDLLADFRPYLQRMIEHHEAGEIPQFYVPVSVQIEPDEQQALPDFRLLEPLIDTWLTEPERNHISIMGDFGSGKTWFCKYYSYLAAKRYLSDPARNRIPILITLRDYSRAYDVEQLITDVIVNHFKIGLAAGYKTFSQLNEAGRLLLIFDGFDEMERRISDYRTTVDNFWELAKVVSPASKVILTCRTAYFRHRNEERDTLILRRSHISMRAGDQVIDLRNRNGFELIRLLDFTDEDIQLALQKRIPQDWQQVYKKIQALPNLRDLASRPVLLDMIVKTLPQIHAADQTNQATLYETYVNTLLQRREGNDTDFIPPQGRLYFVEELAWEMYQTGRLTIPFSEFPERVMKHFHLQNDPERAVFFERDVRTQSYLVRDNDGNYRFGHKSFLEFFVARKMADAISGSDYDITRAIEIWKSRQLTHETGDFLVHMVADCAPLWQMIEATRNKTMVDVGYAGGNAATLLQLRGESFAQKDLSHTVLAGADLHHSDLTRTDLRGASLRLANLSGCTLVQTDVREADLTNVRIEEMGAVEAVMFDPSGEVVASGSADGIVRLWKWTTAEQVGQFPGGTHVTSIRFSPDGQFILAGVGHHGHDGYIKMWYRENAELVGLFVGHTGPVWDISFCPGQRRFASGAHDGSVRMWDVDTHTQVGIIHKRERGIWEICYSPDGAYIAVAGGAELEIYDAQTGTLVWVAPEKAVEFRSVKYSNTNLLAYTTREGNIFMRDATDKKFICGMRGTQPGPNSIAFSPEGRWLAIGCGGTEAKVQIWDTHSGTLKTEIGAGVVGYVGKIHWSLQNYLVGGFSDGTVRIWDVDSSRSTFSRCLRRLETRAQCQGMHIGNAYGLDTPAPDGRGTLRNWFITRGARA